jgi:hypothetical protein
LLLPAAARADDAPADDGTAKARAAFVKGTELVAKAEWAEALASFEAAAQLKPHAIATFNIGACQRAMGQYTRARASFAQALDQNEKAGGGQLSSSLSTEAAGYVKELDGLLARADVNLEPATADIAVDGRPLAVTGNADGQPLAVAGTRPPGPAEQAPAKAFVLVVDPGAHVIVISRKGYADSVVNQTFAPGSRKPLALLLDTLPGTIHIGSNRNDSVVHIDDADVGNPPLDVSRHEGSYRVVVLRKGFLPYDAQVVVRPGERVDVEANLLEDKPSLYQRWWFWAGAGVLLTGAAVTTYFVARPAPERPPPDTGSLGWAVRLP